MGSTIFRKYHIQTCISIVVVVRGLYYYGKRLNKAVDPPESEGHSASTSAFRKSNYPSPGLPEYL